MVLHGSKEALETAGGVCRQLVGRGEIDTMGINFTPAMDGIKMREPAGSWVATFSENTSDSSLVMQNHFRIPSQIVRNSCEPAWDFQRNGMICWELFRDFFQVFSRCLGRRKVWTDSLHTSARNTSWKRCKWGKLNSGNLFPENWFKWGKSGRTSSLKF